MEQPRPQRRTVAAERFLLTFASNTDDPLGTGPVFRRQRSQGGRRGAGQGNWRLGGHMPHTPPRRALGKNSLPLRSLLVVTRHRAWSNSPYQWDPCPSVNGRQFRGFCPPTPLWNYGSSWLRAPSRDQMVMDLFTGDDHSGESQGIFPPFMIGCCTASPRFFTQSTGDKIG